MSIFLREPNPGDRISANLIRDIIRAIKEIRPIQGRGINLKRSPNGTTLNAMVPQHTSKTASTDIGCYAIESIDHDKDDPLACTIHFKNEIYRVGGKTYGEFNKDGDGRSIHIQDSCIVYLEISADSPAPEVVIKQSESLLKVKQAEKDTTKYVIPLYAFGAGGIVMCDFRTAPSAAMFEFSM